LNLDEHSVDIRHDVIVPEAQYTVALSFKKSRSSEIGLNAFGMLVAVDFDD
jgi:hypothetical protein